MKKQLTYALTAVLTAVMPLTASAQDAATAVTTGSGVPKIFFEPSFYILSGLFLVMFITIVVLTRVLMKLIRPQMPVRAEEVKIAVETKETESLWTRFDRKFLTRAVPVEKEKDIMLDHGYDGIRELDNDLPPWWKYGFYLTIVWSLVYLVHYHVTDSGKLSLLEYEAEMADAEAAMKARMLKNADIVTSETVTLLTEADGISAGQALYTQNCVACHGSNGEGSVGPNLTDEYWIHGGGIRNVFKTVQNGVPAKGMISWKSQLSPKQIQQVSSYILTLQGSKPANGKEPQGEIWKEEGAATTDSSVVAAKDSVGGAISLR